MTKITIDKKSGELRVGKKTFDELGELEKNDVVSVLRGFIHKNTNMTDYEEDSMWMSYRYCIGRHTIASHMHATGIFKNCYGRMSKERQLFTAYDINREIEWCLRFFKPEFNFPLTSSNRIYTTAVDIVCEFMEEYNIQSIEDFLKYKDVHVILTDNDRGYKFETVTWEEWLRPRVHKEMKEHFNNDAMSEDYAWNYFNKWKNNEISVSPALKESFDKLSRDMPNPEHYYMNDFEDLFVWNDLVHCFDYEHHHKSILNDDSECEWFWTWTNKTEQREDCNYYKTFGYKKIRVPVNDWTGSVTKYIPDDAIKENIY